MASYRYNVVIDVDFDVSDANSEKIKDELKSWEQNAINSMNRVNRAKFEGALQSETQRQKLVNQSIAAEEKATTSIIGEYIKRGNASDAYNKKLERDQAARAKTQTALTAQRIREEKAAAEYISKLWSDGLKAQDKQLEQKQKQEKAAVDYITKLWKKGLKEQEDANKAAAREEKRLWAEVEASRKRVARNSEQTANIIEQSTRKISRSYELQGKIQARNVQQSLKPPGGGSGGGDALLTALGFGGTAGLVTAIVDNTLDAIRAGISAGIDQAVSAGIEAARYERVKNAMIAVTGSVREASRSLAEFNQLAQTTPGLSFNAAVEGAQRLRAVGFEANEARDAIVGLSKVRLLSGSTKQDLEAVLINFAQIRSIGKLTGDELRETLGRLPYFATVLNKAFGTISTEKIRSLNLSSDEFFKRINQAMKEIPPVAGGAEDSFEKLMDSYAAAQRAFGTPILAPTTAILKELNILLRSNEKTFVAWGDSVSQVLYGVLKVMQLLTDAGRNLPNLRQFGYNVGSSVSNNPTAGAVGAAVAPRAASYGALGVPGVLAYEGYNFLSNVGQPEQRRAAFEAELKAMQDAEKKAQESRTKFQEENQANRENDEVLAHEESLRRLKQAYDTSKQTTINFYRDITALNTAQVNRTSAQEIAAQEQTVGVLKREYAERYKLAQDYYKRVEETENKRVAGFLPIDRPKAEKVKQARLDEIKADVEAIAAEGNQRIAQATKQLVELRLAATDKLRQEQIESYRQDADDQEFYLGVQRENLQIFLRDESKSYVDAFSEMNSFIEQNYNERIRLTQLLHAEQLRDDRLSGAERANLLKRQAAEIRRLEFQRDSEKTQNTFTFEDFNLRRLQDDTRRDADRLLFGLNREAVSNRRAALLGGLSSQDLEREISAIERQARDFRQNASQAQANATYESNKIDLVFGGSATNQEALAAFQAQEQQFNASAEDRERRAEQMRRFLGKNEQEIAVELIRIQQDSDYQRYLIERERLQKNADAAAAIPEQQRLILDQIEKLDRDYQIKSEEGWTDYFDAVSKLPQKQLDRAIERYQKLLGGDAKTLQDLQTNIRTDFTNQRSNEIEDLARAEFELANYGQGADIRARLEAMNILLDNYKDEEQAVYDIMRAQNEIARQGEFSANRANARLLDFFAQQKGITEIFSDARISLISSVYDGLDRTFERLTSRMGIFGNTVKDILSSFAKLALNKIFTRLLGLDTGSGAGAGGFSIPGFGGGNGGGFSVPGFGGGIFNIGGGGGAGSILQLLGGGGFGGNGNASIPAINIGDITATRPRIVDPANIGTAGGGLFANLRKLVSGGSAGGGIGGLLPILGAGFGAQLGAGSRLGGITGALGGAIGGLAGITALASIGATGALGTGALGVGISGLLGLGGSTLAATGVLAPVAAALLIGTYFISRSAKRRQQEVQRTQFLNEAVNQIRAIAREVDGGLDAATATQRAEQVYAQYIENANKLTDSKTRRIALESARDVRRAIDVDLANAIQRKADRDARKNLLVPTFADGGATSGFVSSHFRNNPLGYVLGAGNSRSDSIRAYFPAANRFAKISNTEYVLDAETTRNIGVENLDALRRSRGAAFRRVVLGGGASSDGYADGGAVGLVTNGSSAPEAGNTTLEVNANITIGRETFFEVVDAYLRTPDGQRHAVNAARKNLKQQGANSDGLGTDILKLVNKK